jgi:hypothetical protein
MKKNKILLAILVVIASVTLYMISRNTGSTIRDELKDFAVKDTSKISKIFLADRNGNSVILERSAKNEWLLNGKYEPKPDFLNLLMDCFYSMRVKNKVAKSAYNNVIKMLSSTGIKCEIYFEENDKPIKTYYVGGQTEDALGTYMMLENSASPFIMEIPGFNGYLTPRYSVSEDAWRITSLFRIQLKDLNSVTVSYLNFPEKSFALKNNNNRFTLHTPHKSSSAANSDSVAIENYLSFYSGVYYENRVTDKSISFIDSILQLPPSITIEVKDKSNKIKSLDIYPMPITSASLSKEDETGKPLKFDQDRMYGFLKPENELVVIQQFAFDRLLRQYSDFLAKARK